MSRVRQSRMAGDFITPLRTVHNLELKNHCFFLEFSIYYFWTTVDQGYLKPWKTKPQIRGRGGGDYCIGFAFYIL